MKITNKYGLPGAIVEAIKNDNYTAGKHADISCTTLIGPPQIRILNKQYGGELEVDASDRIFALMGQAIHAILERAEKDALVENRLYMEANGWTLSGQYDRMTLRNRTLQDYKVCSVWEVIYGVKPDREAQLNVLAELAYENGHTDITGLEIVAILRDWQKSKAKFDKDYPQAQVQRIPVKLWDRSVRRAYIAERVRLHQEAEKGRVEPCSASERWAKDDCYAVMKDGRKSALRVLPSEEDAIAWCESNGHIDPDGEIIKGISIEFRQGESTRCESYCDVAQYCPQFKAMKP